MKIAIVHDWLVTYAGAERVLEQIVKSFPGADIFTVVDFLPEQNRKILGSAKVQTTFIQRLPFAEKKYRQYLPLMPLAVEQLDLSNYNLVLSSSYAVAKGILVGPDQVHICFCHSPIRYAWDLQHQYLQEVGLTKGLRSLVARSVLHYVRLWDTRTSNGVDEFIANSEFIRRRIRRVYGREARVIYPPVDVEAFSYCPHKEKFYVTASRMVPYKRVGMIVDAFAALPDRQLFVIGDGPEFERVSRRAPKNVVLLGHQPFLRLRDYLQRARAFVYAAEEDFGIIPVEAQACGTPVIAYGRGGVLESVIGGEGVRGRTGLFFDKQSPTSIAAAIRRFEDVSGTIEPSACRQNALRFSVARFQKEYVTFVLNAVNHYFGSSACSDLPSMRRSSDTISKMV